MKSVWLIASSAVVLLVGAPSRAQILSPGKLAKAHSHIEGLRNCTECHELGKKVDGELCLGCHRLIAKDVGARQGFHGRLAAAGKKCVECHREHRGVDASLVDWGGPVEAFDHAATGYPLRGKHAQIQCEACHNARLVKSEKLRTRLARNPLATYLGLTTGCTACHFDEHRGQLGKDCERCHGMETLERAPSFEHDTVWPLEGGHRRARCEQCHPRVEDSRSYERDPPPKNPDSLVRYDLDKVTCTSCHRDVHGGKFGSRCKRCHDLDGWRVTRLGGKDTRFHQKTRFPLRGKHQKVACEGCHPPKRGGGMITRGIRFDSCNRCHVDAHLGQIEPNAQGFVLCERCHDVKGFYPPRFSINDHATTRYPLEGAHRAVACNACHRPAPEELERKVPKEIREKTNTPLRANQLINFTKLVMPEKSLDRCESCHQGPHAGQFTLGGTPKACKDCHVVTSFEQPVFDHERDTDYPLRGKHAKAACDQCHGRPTQAPTTPVRYRGTPKRCAACHKGPHAGQFDSALASGTDCNACHDQRGFRPSSFSHVDPARSIFRLDGAHLKVPCTRCHPVVEREGLRAAWYRGVPKRCDGCHADAHARSSLTTTEKLTDCGACHSTAGWSMVRFDHTRTRLPLDGRHGEIPCRACHLELRRLDIDPSCASCHVDPHAGRLGENCARCHETTSFSDGAGVQAHERTRFPLVGRHAMVPCEECHLSRADRTFGGAPTRCVSCHRDAYERTAGRAVDHRQAGIGTDCERCHNPVSWQRGIFPEHERCFPLARGSHRGIECLDCHTSLSGLDFSGCDSFTASCTRCHRCAKMNEEHLGEDRVPGYQCTDRKCYECHPAGRGD